MLDFFTAKVMAIISGVLVLLLLAFGTYHYFYVGMLKGHITELNQSVGTLTSQNAILTQNNLKLSLSLNTQNRAIEDLKVEQAASAARSSKLLEAATQATKTLKTKYDKLLHSQRPPGSPDQALALKVDEFLSAQLADVVPQGVGL